MPTYIAFFQGKTQTFQANSLYDAKLQAIQHFQPKKKDQGLLSVVYYDKPVATEGI